MDTAVEFSPAEIYERQFVPALFGYWGDRIAEIARIQPGEQVLDVACGTGVLACAAAQRAGAGCVSGLDINDGMLTVARLKSNNVDWLQGKAESLPYEDNRFDGVVSQFGFMFFDDQPGALKEMMRVLKPAGRLRVAVCDALDHSPGYAVLTELLERKFGHDIALAFRSPFNCGDREDLLNLCRNADINNATVTRYDGPVRFDSIRSLIAAERACAWTLGGLLSESQFGQLLSAAEESFQPFVTHQGQIEFNMPVLLIAANKDC